ncbi:39S ribosomal protein L35, mitochondrial [Aphelenchoides fujianensis]|nr:39S ribosomal protein L35, mitochondrial [Aphelenchoides fujianensis]
MFARASTANLLRPAIASGVQSSRNVARIPHWEHHIRFDPRDGRKRPAQDVLDRFKRLNNGMWIRPHAGRNKQRYAKDDVFNEISYNYETCTREECEMLDRMMTPFWLRRKHYVDDPYEPYQTRHGINSPRVDYKGRLVRERAKVLLDDLTSDKHFFDR